MKVVVAMSGGVDSSVAAALLCEAGHEVIGVTLQIWPADRTAGSRRTGCCSLDAVEDARRVASILGIPHYVFNFQDLFERTVILDFVEQYRAGRTPNPCVRCNQWIKFDALLNRALALGADRLATGHYARVQFDKASGRWLLMRSADHSKDQSYALYMLTQAQLARSVFPLGDLTKEETRRVATRLGLPVAEKADSQELCFVRNGSYTSFLKTRAPEALRPGVVVDEQGRTLGRHPGIAFYTIGQRKGLGVSAREPLYVKEIRPETAEVVVAGRESIYARRLVADEFNLVSVDSLQEPTRVTAKIRYNMVAAPAVLRPLTSQRVEVEFDEPQRAVTPGQSVVCYHGECVVGGGIID
ncbi:MAG: tRNA 2-thiouridine(34) synthase MnmA, partial [Armatimonadota bacterium]